ncbi:MAG: HU family DNA-binding protein [Defluviicoccus sp.]|nr:HU family DNA-binding protein [Defluviicoccus sp.]
MIWILVWARKLADHRQRLAERQRPRAKAVPQVVQASVVESGAFPYALPLWPASLHSTAERPKSFTDRAAHSAGGCGGVPAGPGCEEIWKVAMKVLKRVDLTDAVRREVDQLRLKSARFVDAVFEEIREALVAGEPVMVSGLGSLETLDKGPRMGAGRLTSSASPTPCTACRHPRHAPLLPSGAGRQARVGAYKFGAGGRGATAG